MMLTASRGRASNGDRSNTNTKKTKVTKNKNKKRAKTSHKTVLTNGDNNKNNNNIGTSRHDHNHDHHHDDDDLVGFPAVTGIMDEEEEDENEKAVTRQQQQQQQQRQQQASDDEEEETANNQLSSQSMRRKPNGKVDSASSSNTEIDDGLATMTKARSSMISSRSSSFSSSSSSSGSTLDWSALCPPLSAPTLRAISQSFHFDTMTPVQSTAIPLFMSNKDVAVQAQTGSGKTLSYLIPMVEILYRRPDPPLRPKQVGGIVIAPTRELASQIYAVLQKLLIPYFQGGEPDSSNNNNHNINSSTTTTGTISSSCNQSSSHSSRKLCGLLLVGGTDTSEDLQNFRTFGGNIVVATPGRLEDTLARVPDFSVRELEVLVLDEADRLLDMGFQVCINHILNKLPKQRRTGLFSATQTQEVKELVRAGLRNPCIIEVQVDTNQKTANVAPAVDGQLIPTSLSNFYTMMPAAQKLCELVRFLAAHASTDKCIVFQLTCACVDYFAKILSSLPALKHVQVFGLHGQMVQKKRNEVYKRYVDADAGVLLCTDLVARGIDIPDVHWIVQYDPPQDPSFFVHRIGRTARMGRYGQAIVYLLPTEDTYVEFLKVKKCPVIPRAREPALHNRVTDGSGANRVASSVAAKSPGSASTATKQTGTNTSTTTTTATSTAAATVLAAVDIDQAEAAQLTEEIRAMAVADRDVMEKGQRAFVSFVRAYKEHHCNYIFRINLLPYGQLATGIGLLYFPAMSELKNRTISEFIPSPVKASTITFADLHRERQRLANVELQKQKLEKERREREADKQAKFKKKQKATPKRRNKHRQQELEAEWLDLAAETRAMKKLASGKISQRQFEEEVGEATVTGGKDNQDSDDGKNGNSNGKTANMSKGPTKNLATKRKGMMPSSNDSSDDDSDDD